MQKLIIAGNVGRDSELRNAKGTPVLGFSVAVDGGKDKDGNKRPATWYDCSIWGKRAESLERYIKKGTRLTLVGRPTAREYEGKAYLGISVDDFTFMGGGDSSGDTGGGSYERDKEPQQRDLDDEIPF